MFSLFQDFRYAVRQAKKNLGLTGAVVFVLALGIAANSVTFTILQATLLSPLPYPEPHRLAQLLGARHPRNFCEDGVFLSGFRGLPGPESGVRRARRLCTT